MELNQPARTLIEVAAILLFVTSAAAPATGLTTASPKPQARLQKSSQALEVQLNKSPSNIKLRERLGFLLIRNKSYKHAIEILAPYSNDISENALIALADAYRQSGDSLNEIRMLEQLVARDPDHFRPHYLLGLAYKRANKLTKAAESLRQSITLAPGHRPSYDALLDIFMSSKQDYESRTLVSDMIRQFGPKKDLLAIKCKLLANDGYLKDAINACNSAITADPSLPDNHVYLAQAYYDRDKTDASERIFKTAAREFQHSEFVQYAAGQFYFQQKNFPTAVRYLTKAVQLDGKSVRSQLSLARSLFESRNYGDALIHFNIACHLDKLKDSIMAFKNAAARLRDDNETEWADKYDARTSVCQFEN